MIDPIEAIRSLKARIGLLARRGEITAVDDSGDALRVQVSSSGLTGRWLEVVLPFGLHVLPKVGAEALLAAIGGLSGHQVVSGISDRRYRAKGMGDGDAALKGQHESMVRTHASGVAVTGNTTVDGTVDASDGFKSGGTSGKTGTLTVQVVQVAAPGVPVVLLVETHKGGIRTAIQGTTSPWIVAPGDSVTAVWVGD